MMPQTSRSRELRTPKANETTSSRTSRATAPGDNRERVGHRRDSRDATARAGHARRRNVAAPLSSEHSELLRESVPDQQTVSPRKDRESPVHWMLRVRAESGIVTATVGAWQDAGRLNGGILRGAIEAGALQVARSTTSRRQSDDVVDSESLLTLLCREVVYAGQLDLPPAWRRRLDASVESAPRRRGLRATRTRPATAAPAIGRAE